MSCLRIYLSVLPCGSPHTAFKFGVSYHSILFATISHLISSWPRNQGRKRGTKMFTSHMWQKCLQTQKVPKKNSSSGRDSQTKTEKCCLCSPSQMKLNSINTWRDTREQLRWRSTCPLWNTEEHLRTIISTSCTEKTDDTRTAGHFNNLELRAYLNFRTFQTPPNNTECPT